jgi:AcrR family transcriptional regulator
MTPPAARRRNPERTEARRQQVLDAAMDCFRKEGFRGASMAAVSAAAGMSPGHIYHYFPSKESIVEAIVEFGKEQFLPHIEDLKTQPNILQSLIDGLVMHLGECQPGCATLNLEIFAEASRNPVVGEIMRNHDVFMSGHLRDALEIGRRQGSIDRDADIEGAIALIASILKGYGLRLAVRPDLDSGIIRRLIPPLLRNLLGPKSARQA